MGNVLLLCFPLKSVKLEQKQIQEIDSVNKTNAFQLFDAFKSHETFERLRNDHVDNSSLLVENYSWLSISLGIFVLFGFFGNLMVCLAIKFEPKLQNTTNFYLLSLAITDLLVSVIVIPLAIVKLVFSKWILGRFVCAIWIFFDVFLCTESIFLLCVISCERYIGIKEPIKNRDKSKLRARFLIFLTLILSLLLSLPIFVLGYIDPENLSLNGTCQLNNKYFITYGSIFAFIIPFFIMIIMYSLTVHRLRKVLKEFQCQSDNKNHVHLSFRPRVDKVKKRFDILSFFSPRKRSKSSSEQQTHAVANGKQQVTSNGDSTENQIGQQQPKCQQIELKQRNCANENEETECLMSVSKSETTKHTEITISETNKELVNGQLEAHVDILETPQIKALSTLNTQVDVLRENPRSCLKLTNKVLSKSEQIQPVSSCEAAQMTTCDKTKKTHLVESGKFISLSLSLKTLSRESKLKGVNEMRMSTKTVSINESLNDERSKAQFDLEINGDDSNRSSLKENSAERLAQVRKETEMNNAKNDKFKSLVNKRQLVNRAVNAFKRSQRTAAIKNEQKAVKVLGVVFIIFVIAWVPFAIANILSVSLIPQCSTQSVCSTVLNVLTWFGYVSSVINPLVYNAFNEKFRLAFRRILTCDLEGFKRKHAFVSMSNSNLLKQSATFESQSKVLFVNNSNCRFTCTQQPQALVPELEQANQLMSNSTVNCLNRQHLISSLNTRLKKAQFI